MGLLFFHLISPGNFKGYLKNLAKLLGVKKFASELLNGKGQYQKYLAANKAMYHIVSSPAAALRGATATTEAEDPFDSEEGL